MATNVETPASVVEAERTQSVHQREHREHSAAPVRMSSAACACCRRLITGASSALLAVHVRCWRLAGERIRRVSRAAIDRRARAEMDGWRDEYVDAEVRLRAEGWL